MQKLSPDRALVPCIIYAGHSITVVTSVTLTSSVFRSVRGACCAAALAGLMAYTKAQVTDPGPLGKVALFLVWASTTERCQRIKSVTIES